VPGQEHRNALVIVHVRIAHRAPVQHQRMIQQIAVAVRRVLQLVEEVRQHRDVELVDLTETPDVLVGDPGSGGRARIGCHQRQR